MRGFLPLTSFLLLLSTPLFAAPIYKWVDAQGVTHFGSQPSPANQSEQVKTKTFQPQPTTKLIVTDNLADDTPTQAEIEREVRKQVAQESAELQKYCTELRYNLAHLKNNPRILAQVDGKPKRLTEEERQARIADTEKSLNERCANIK